MNELPSGFTKRKAAQESDEFAALRNSAALLDDIDFQGIPPDLIPCSAAPEIPL